MKWKGDESINLEALRYLVILVISVVAILNLGGAEKLLAKLMKNKNVLAELNINTGGGAYIEGNTSIGGDFIGRDKVVNMFVTVDTPLCRV